MALDTYKRMGGRKDDLIPTTAQLIGYTKDYTALIGLAKLQCQTNQRFGLWNNFLCHRAKPS